MAFNYGAILGIGGMIIGGAIGGYFGGPAGASLGASIGGMIGGVAGSLLFPVREDLNLPPPPKPNESRLQISTYGAAIPIVYESARLAGNIIEMQDVQEDIDRSRHRNNGVRYYEMVKQYTSTLAISFCEGEVVGISRIWINGKLFADWRDGTSPYYPVGSGGLVAGNLATTTARSTLYFSVYLGTETQTADPTLASIYGAANVPAYRGICYIVFKDFPVGEYTGVPHIEVEIGDPTPLAPAILLGRTLDITLDDDGVPSGAPGNQPGYTGLNIDFYYYGVAYEVSAIHAAGTVQNGYAWCAWWPAGRRVRMFILFDGVCYHSDIVTPYTEGKNSTTFSWIQFPFTDGPTFSADDVGDSVRFGFEILDGGAYGVVKLPRCPYGESWLFDHEESGSGCEASGSIWLGGGVNLGVIFVNY